MTIVRNVKECRFLCRHLLEGGRPAVGECCCLPENVSQRTKKFTEALNVQGKIPLNLFHISVGIVLWLLNGVFIIERIIVLFECEDTCVQFDAKD